jgi:hypothetical protein
LDAWTTSKGTTTLLTNNDLSFLNEYENFFEDVFDYNFEDSFDFNLFETISTSSPPQSPTPLLPTSLMDNIELPEIVTDLVQNRE